MRSACNAAIAFLAALTVAACSLLPQRTPTADRAGAAASGDWQEWSCQVNTISNDSGVSTGGIRQRVRVSVMQGRVLLIDEKGEREATDVRFTADGVSFRAEPGGNYWWLSTRNGATRADVRGVRQTGSGRCVVAQR